MRPEARMILVLAIVASLATSACGPTETAVATPREPGSDAVGHYCRMTLAEHKGPKGQILPRGWKDPLWFSSVRDALTYVQMDIVSERELAAFWVNDMGQGSWDEPAPGSWIDARTAWFVVGSAKASGMGGGEAVPFKETGAAQTFARENGGRIVSYHEALAFVATPESDPANGGGT